MEVQGRTDLRIPMHIHKRRPEWCHRWRRLVSCTVIYIIWLSLQSCTSGGSTPPSLGGNRTPTSGPRPLQTVVAGRTPTQNPPQGTIPAGSGTPGTSSTIPAGSGTPGSNPTLSASGTVAPGLTLTPVVTRTPGGVIIPPLLPTTANPPLNPTRSPSVPPLPPGTPTQMPAFPPAVPPGLPVPVGETARVRVKMSTSGQITYTIEAESGLAVSDVRYELAQVASSNSIAGSGSYLVAYSPGFSLSFKAGNKSCSAQVNGVTLTEVIVSGRSGGGVVCGP